MVKSYKRKSGKGVRSSAVASSVCQRAAGMCARAELSTGTGVRAGG